MVVIILRYLKSDCNANRKINGMFVRRFHISLVQGIWVLYFIFIVPCIVIFYGITNRCNNVQ